MAVSQLGDRLVVCDIETMGLEPDEQPIMEVGFVITDLDFKTIDEWAILIWDTPLYEKAWEKATDYVKEMHTKNNLLSQCQAYGFDVEKADHAICDWLSGHGIGSTPEPMTGSSVHFDRSFFDAQMPDVNKHFHYRNIDVSTIKELCKRFNPAVYAKLSEVSKVEAHRAISDCYDTLHELQFYVENFLFDGRPAR